MLQLFPSDWWEARGTRARCFECIDFTSDVRHKSTVIRQTQKFSSLTSPACRSRAEKPRSGNYNFDLWKRDLKAVISAAGVEGTPTVLYIEDHQILTPAFLELLNSLLSEGEIPGLYAELFA